MTTHVPSSACDRCLRCFCEMTPNSTLVDIWWVSKVNKNTNLHMLYNRLTEAWTSEGLFSKNSAFYVIKSTEKDVGVV